MVINIDEIKTNAYGDTTWKDEEDILTMTLRALTILIWSNSTLTYFARLAERFDRFDILEVWCWWREEQKLIVALIWGVSSLRWCPSPDRHVVSDMNKSVTCISIEDP